MNINHYRNPNSTDKGFNYLVKCSFWYYLVVGLVWNQIHVSN